MSRDAFLARMALGRSMYESPSQDPEPPIQPTRSDQQQYNARGEPISLATKHHNEAMIKASNEVLAAVGVCEKKDRLIDRLSEELPDGEQIIKEGEDDIGEIIRMTGETSRNLLTWWVMGLRRQIQVDFISSSLSFVDILSGEWTSLTSKSVLGSIRQLTAGGPAEVVSQLMLTFIDWYLDEQVLNISKRIIRMRASNRKRFLLLRCVNYSYQVTNALLHLSVYPLASLSCLQQLGHIPAKTLLPSKSWLTPWSPLSPLRWAFYNQKTVGGSKLLGLLLSPAGIWLTMTLAQHSAASTYGHVPLFEYNCILGPHNIGSLQQTDNSESSFLTPFSRLRDKALRLLGWAPALSISKNETQDLTRELSVRNHASTSQHGTATRHRVTELSTLPANLLALNLDYFFWTIMMLPLDILHLNSLASAFSTSPAAGLGVENGGFQRVVPGLAVSRMAKLNKIGLCLALEFTIDTAVWGGAFVWARYVGTSRYYWGRT
ncbi:hypothetical protein E4T44_05397 [Aureobasidium sp. EXF-8845]|nr:hypothetical protein E4T44_05397 [Aureobasidium sp. EXF-8845]KAI4849854.1 hypothetical protein E4T45_05752 [Aureobasidium sp. EXF-8846]